MKRPVHPFFFAVFPIIFVYSHNLGEVLPRQLLVPILGSVLLMGCFWMTGIAITRNVHKASILCSFLLVIFFSYGHILHILSGITGPSVYSRRHEIMLSLLCALIPAGSLLILKLKKNLKDISYVFNVTGLVLVLLPASQIGYHMSKSGIFQKTISNHDPRLLQEGHAPSGKKYPDMFYIITDGYARADVLREKYNFNNSAFLEKLKTRGFQIAQESRSNYTQTPLSLASSLNFSYLDDVADRVGKDCFSREPLLDIIQNNRLFTVLKQHGYQTLAFSSGYGFTEIRNADMYLSITDFFDEFQMTLIQTTMLRGILEVVDHNFFISWLRHFHRKRLLYILDTLPVLEEMDTPVFVFAHILAPANHSLLQYREKLNIHPM